MLNFLLVHPLIEKIIKEELLPEIVATAVAAAFVTFLGSKTYLYIKKRIRRRPRIKEFREKYVKPYEGKPDGGKPNYYAYSGHPSQDGRKPTYHFFVEESVQIEQFMGFLIPPMDFGHGRQNKRERGEFESELDFNEEWDLYLTKMGDKAKRLKNSTDEDGNRLFRRIIFFNKDVLLLFLENYSKIFKAAQMQGSGFRVDPEDSENSRLRSLARSIILYSCDIGAIHKRVYGQKNYFDCYYLDKSVVPSSKYYDFGLYRIEGIDVIYNPIYVKDGKKSIVEERVLIGTQLEQRRRIEEYKEDFRDLWDIAVRDKQNQDILMEKAKEKYFEGDKYYSKASLSVEFFEKGYGKALNRIFEEMGIELP